MHPNELAQFDMVHVPEEGVLLHSFSLAKLIFILNVENMPHETQLIYNATAGPSLAQSNLQSVGEYEFAQFIPDTMPQFSMWDPESVSRSTDPFADSQSWTDLMLHFHSLVQGCPNPFTPIYVT